MLLHLEDAVHQWHSKVSIRTVDADVVVQAITVAQHLYISELWVAFGVGKPYDFLLLMRLPVMCRMCLLISFLEVESDTWTVFGDVTSAFSALFSTPILQIIEECGQLK